MGEVTAPVARSIERPALIARVSKCMRVILRQAWAAQPRVSGLIEQVFAPLIVALAEQSHQVTAGVEAERARGAVQFHAGLVGGAAAFAVIAGVAAGDEVFPGGFAGAGARDDVIECEFP